MIQLKFVFKNDEHIVLSMYMLRSEYSFLSKHTLYSFTLNFVAQPPLSSDVRVLVVDTPTITTWNFVKGTKFKSLIN